LGAELAGEVIAMDCTDFELPTPNGIANACKQFDSDSETRISEKALADLLAKYPNNTNEAQVLLKVLTLNDLYSTQIPLRAPDRPNVFDIAECIPRLGLDQALQERSLEIVNVISVTQFPGKKRVNRFSFATKYASWHRQNVYPMWDRNVQNYLTCLRGLHRLEWDKFSDGFKLSSNDWGYPEFHALMVRFRVHYGLEDMSFKDLDKFLWLHGSPRTACLVNYIIPPLKPRFVAGRRIWRQHFPRSIDRAPLKHKPKLF
jgi:hypothetical protein